MIFAFNLKEIVREQEKELEKGQSGETSHEGRCEKEVQAEYEHQQSDWSMQVLCSSQQTAGCL